MADGRPDVTPVNRTRLFVRRLDEAGISIDDIGVNRPTLDDVFLELTGQAAEAGEEEPDLVAEEAVRR